MTLLGLNKTTETGVSAPREKSPLFWDEPVVTNAPSTQHFSRYEHSKSINHSPTSQAKPEQYREARKGEEGRTFSLTSASGSFLEREPLSVVAFQFLRSAELLVVLQVVVEAFGAAIVRLRQERREIQLLGS